MEYKIKKKENLRKLREERGLSQTALGKVCKVGYISVSRWENGQAEINTPTVLRLAKFFKVSTDVILQVKKI